MIVKTTGALLLALTTLTLAACSTTPNVSPSTTPTPVTPSSPVASVPSTTPSTAAKSAPSTSASVAAPSTTARPSTAALSGCTPDQLTGKTGASDGQTGHIGLELIVTNVSGLDCTLKGYPRVQIVGGGNGTTISAKAEHSYFGYKGEGDTKLRQSYEPRITLKAGGGIAYLTVGSSSVYDYIASDKQTKDPYSAAYAKTCGHAVKADGYRVYLPGESTALFIAYRGGFPACSSGNNDLITTEFYPTTYN